MTRRLLFVLGLLVLGYGLFGAVTDPGSRLPGQAVFAIAVLATHDLLVMPLAIGLGWLASRRLPGWARGPVQGGLFCSAVLTAVALPFILGNGHPADNPSALPLNYGRGLALVLAFVWLGVGLLLVRGRGGKGA